MSDALDVRVFQLLRSGAVMAARSMAMNLFGSASYTDERKRLEAWLCDNPQLVEHVGDGWRWRPGAKLIETPAQPAVGSAAVERGSTWERQYHVERRYREQLELERVNHRRQQAHARTELAAAYTTIHVLREKLTALGVTEKHPWESSPMDLSASPAPTSSPTPPSKTSPPTSDATATTTAAATPATSPASSTSSSPSASSSAPSSSNATRSPAPWSLAETGWTLARRRLHDALTASGGSAPLKELAEQLGVQAVAVRKLAKTYRADFDYAPGVRGRPGRIALRGAAA